MNFAGLVSIVVYGMLILALVLNAGDHERRILALETPPVGTVTIIVPADLRKLSCVPADLRKLSCVPMEYLLSNRRIGKIHSYAKSLPICGETSPKS